MGNTLELDLVYPRRRESLAKEAAELATRLEVLGLVFEKKGASGPWEPWRSLAQRVRPPADPAEGQGLEAKAHLHLPSVGGARGSALRYAFEEETVGPHAVLWILTLKSLPNGAYGRKMDEPRDFFWLQVSTSIRMGGTPFDGKLYRVITEVIDPLADPLDLFYMQDGDDGYGSALDLGGAGFPPPCIAPKQLGLAGVIAPSLRDEALDLVFDRFEAGDFDDPDATEKLSALRQTGFERLLRLRNGGLRYLDVEGNAISRDSLDALVSRRTPGEGTN